MTVDVEFFCYTTTSPDLYSCARNRKNTRPTSTVTRRTSSPRPDLRRRRHTAHRRRAHRRPAWSRCRRRVSPSSGPTTSPDLPGRAAPPVAQPARPRHVELPGRAAAIVSRCSASAGPRRDLALPPGGIRLIAYRRSSSDDGASRSVRGPGPAQDRTRRGPTYAGPVRQRRGARLGLQRRRPDPCTSMSQGLCMIRADGVARPWSARGLSVNQLKAAVFLDFAPSSTSP